VGKTLQNNALLFACHSDSSFGITIREIIPYSFQYGLQSIEEVHIFKINTAQPVMIERFPSRISK
jgi:hypothetical protein